MEQLLSHTPEEFFLVHPLNHLFFAKSPLQHCRITADSTSSHDRDRLISELYSRSRHQCSIKKVIVHGDGKHLFEITDAIKNPPVNKSPLVKKNKFKVIPP